MSEQIKIIANGNYIPATETANNARFLRNDNTWQTITPGNIGAATSGHTHSYLPLSGGTITGQISKANTYTSWYTGRDVAPFKTVAESSPTDAHYVPCWSAKSYQGSWDCGPYTSNTLHLSYITDVNYNSKTNTQTADFTFATDGTFNAKVLKQNGTAVSLSGHTHSNYLTGITKDMVTNALGYTPPTTNTTYSAGTGLALNGSSFNVTIPRVAKDSKSIPGVNKVVFEEYTAGTTYNLPSNHWYHIITMEGSDANYATQLALGMTTTAAYYRCYNNKTWSDWKSIINTNTTYNFAGTTFNSGNKDVAEHNANNAIKNGNYYYTSNGPATTLGASTADGALYVQSYSDTWVGQIAQDYRNGNLFTRGKNNGTWQAWKAVSYNGHTHDDRYYTETEINTKLAGKLDATKITSGTSALVAGSSSLASGVLYFQYK